VQMAQNLQKQGPLVLKSLGESNLLHLVEVLISDKKWIVECSSQASPFKLIWPAGKSSKFSNPNSNGLRSLFLGSPLPSSMQELAEHGVENRHQDHPRTGISPSVIHKRTSGKSRREILSDCQKLVDDIVKEYPEGFKIGSFGRLFLKRYGYSLDLQKLGYQKLASLLQIMNGVKIQSTYIIPSGKVTKGYGLETADPNVKENNVNATVSISTMDDNLDSPWEELGPIANNGPIRNEIGLGLSRKGEEPVGQIHNDYETLSGDDFSDSEEENLPSAKSKGPGKTRIDEEDSSLLQILDSWYSSKEDSSKRDASGTVDGMVDCSGNGFKQSASAGVGGVKSETPVVNYGRKQRASKNYSFVSQQDSKDELIDGILGSLKKSGEKSAEARI
ncbi:unnamed protein product, partial [Ilex paraguariensis]